MHVFRSSSICHITKERRKKSIFSFVHTIVTYDDKAFYIHSWLTSYGLYKRSTIHIRLLLYFTFLNCIKIMSTIAVAGLGDVAKYVVEELNSLVSSTKSVKIILLSRESRSWFNQQPNTIFRITDYSAESLTKHLVDVDVLISLIHSNDHFYNDVHEAMIVACKASPRCKRFIPSECGGNIEQFPEHPEFYVSTHGAIRKLLEEQNEIEYTLFNQGWFMDYFISANRSYMKRILPVWPLDLENETIRIPGTGNEPIAFTSARDTAKALVRLATSNRKWEKYIYIVGQTTTWNNVIKLIEKIYPEKKLKITYKSLEQLQQDRIKHLHDKDPTELWLAFMDLWNATGASALPMEKVEQQRIKYFHDIHFLNIEQFIQTADKANHVI
jgi:nucleoside-diphosphate-sugar epimerase